ncbi:MAG: mechanosensitive ion channel family protein [Cellvibrionaceae bacterium]
MENIDIGSLYQSAIGYITTYGVQFLLALLVLLIGLWLIGKITRVVNSQLMSNVKDVTLAKFLSSALNIALKVMLVISVASMVGIQTTSFVAILGAAGLAVGLALQGSLSNLAGGVMLLIFRPIRVGDYIESQGYEGEVKEMGIFVTTLETFDKRHIILPNGPLSNGNLVNFTSSEERAIEITFGISYSDDMKAARDALTALMNSDERVLSNEANTIAVCELADSSVNILYRVFVKTEHYWDYFFETQEKGKLALEAAGCTIPFPQRDVHNYQGS